MSRNFNKVFSKLRKYISPTWPNSRYVLNEKFNGEFIFLFCHPNTGSTAMAELIGNSSLVSGLKPKYEGQWLIKGMSRNEKWDERYEFDWHSVVNTWQKMATEIQAKKTDVRYIFEKSPPNMIRSAEFIEHFKPETILVLTRNPYATVSSMLHRYNKKDLLDDEKRKRTIQRLSKNWLVRTEILSKISRSQGSPIIKYENLCRRPTLLKEYLPSEMADSINFDANVMVKDYEPQQIKNVNFEQIKKLTQEEIVIIREIIRGNCIVADLAYEEPHDY